MHLAEFQLTDFCIPRISVLSIYYGNSVNVLAKLFPKVLYTTLKSVIFGTTVDGNPDSIKLCLSEFRIRLKSIF